MGIKGSYGAREKPLKIFKITNHRDKLYATYIDTIASTLEPLNRK